MIKPLKTTINTILSTLSIIALNVMCATAQDQVMAQHTTPGWTLEQQSEIRSRFESAVSPERVSVVNNRYRYENGRFTLVRSNDPTSQIILPRALTENILFSFIGRENIDVVSLLRLPNHVSIQHRSGDYGSKVFLLESLVNRLMIDLRLNLVSQYTERLLVHFSYASSKLDKFYELPIKISVQAGNLFRKQSIELDLSLEFKFPWLTSNRFIFNEEDSIVIKPLQHLDRKLIADLTPPNMFPAYGPWGDGPSCAFKLQITDIQALLALQDGDSIKLTSEWEEKYQICQGYAIVAFSLHSIYSTVDIIRQGEMFVVTKLRYVSNFRGIQDLYTGEIRNKYSQTILEYGV